MRRGLILFFLAVAGACAGDAEPWAPFPLDATNTIYDRRILTNLVEAVNERCAVVTNIQALNHSDFTGFVTRAKLELIDAKIVELVPHFIDRSMINTFNGAAVYNGWYRKYNAGLDVYNFALAPDVTQGLPRLNMPQAFRQAEVGTNIWPMTNWWGIITNFPPYQTEEDRITTYLCRPEWTVVPGRPIVATIAEWRARNIQLPGEPESTWQWIDGRLNTIDGDPMNWANWYGGTLPTRPYPFQGRLYEWDGALPYVEWKSTNMDVMPPAPGYVEGTAYQNDGGGDMYRQGILTNEGLSGTFEVGWPARGNGPVQLTNMHLRVNSVAAGQIGLPANPIEGDVLRIWYAGTTPPTFSGEEPYSGTTRTWANILWRECLNERYRIINAMRWTTPAASGGEWGWHCSTAFVYNCEMTAEWPGVTNAFPIEVFTAGINLPCPPPVTIYTPPDYGVFPGWLERTGGVFTVTNDCAGPSNVGSNQYPRTIYAVGGSNSYASTYYIASNLATNIEVGSAVSEASFLLRWTINQLSTTVSGSGTAVVDYAISAPYATITNAISNLAYAVDFYMFGSNSALMGIDDPEFLPMQTQSVSMAANQWAATGQPVEASVAPFKWEFPATATSSIDTICGAERIADIGSEDITVIIVRAASYLCDTQQVQVTNFTFDGWQYKSNIFNDIPDAGRTNRFETRYYWVLYDPPSDWETTTNAEACYWRVTNFVWSTDPNIGICGSFESDDPEPIFSDVDIVTVASNGLEPWDDLAAIVGFYPTGETRIVDGYTNNAGEPQGDLYLTISTYDPLIPGSITYSNDLIYSYFWQTPVYSNTVPALYAEHSQTNRCAYDPPFGDLITWFAYKGEYSASVALSNSVTNAWIMEWEPVIRWDVVGGFRYVD